MIFNRGIDTMKITALSNHKPGILNNYIRIMIKFHLYTVIESHEKLFFICNHSNLLINTEFFFITDKLIHINVASMNEFMR